MLTCSIYASSRYALPQLLLQYIGSKNSTYRWQRPCAAWMAMDAMTISDMDMLQWAINAWGIPEHLANRSILPILEFLNVIQKSISSDEDRESSNFNRTLNKIRFSTSTMLGFHGILSRLLLLLPTSRYNFPRRRSLFFYVSLSRFVKVELKFQATAL